MARSTLSDIGKKKRIGRPPVNAVPIMVRVPPTELKPIDAWIQKHDPTMSRPEAIRRLVKLGLMARAGK
jgi:hypothetical protein